MSQLDGRYSTVRIRLKRWRRIEAAGCVVLAASHAVSFCDPRGSTRASIARRSARVGARDRGFVMLNFATTFQAGSVRSATSAARTCVR